MSHPGEPVDDIPYRFSNEQVDYFNERHFNERHFNESNEITPFSTLIVPTTGANSVGVNIPENSEKNDRHVDEDINQGQVEPPRQAAGEQFEALNSEGRDRDYQFPCQILDDWYICCQPMSFNSCKQHVEEFHIIPKVNRVVCPWVPCSELCHRKNLDRHIKTRHLNFKRLTEASVETVGHEKRLQSL